MTIGGNQLLSHLPGGLVHSDSLRLEVVADPVFLWPFCVLLYLGFSHFFPPFQLLFSSNIPLNKNFLLLPCVFLILFNLC